MNILNIIELAYFAPLEKIADIRNIADNEFNKIDYAEIIKKRCFQEYPEETRHILKNNSAIRSLVAIINIIENHKIFNALESYEYYVNRFNCFSGAELTIS